MAKININDAGKFTESGNSEFFTLKDDGDVATVRFLYEDENGADIDYFLVHEVEIDSKKRYVSCTAVDDEGHKNPEDCPLCMAGKRAQEKLFLQLYDETDGKLKIWERGKNFVSKIVTYINRYKSLVTVAIEIERKGKKGDTKTTYEFFPQEKDGKSISDFPQKQELEGGYIIKATKEDMYDMLDGVYKIEKDNKQEAPQPRRRESAEQPQANTQSRRRRRGDSF